MRTVAGRPPGDSELCRYVGAVAEAVHAEGVQWWDCRALVAVVVLPYQVPQYWGRRTVIGFNPHFGWSLAVERMVPFTVMIVDGLGLGPRPDPVQVADRVVDLLTDSGGQAPAPVGEDLGWGSMWSRRSGRRIDRPHGRPVAVRARIVCGRPAL